MSWHFSRREALIAHGSSTRLASRRGNQTNLLFGVVAGVAFEKAKRGPFAQFQNSADDADSLTRLVLQLIKRNSEAEPRDEAVRREVNVFLDAVKAMAGSLKPAQNESPAAVEANAVAKLLEDVKVMFRDLPDRLQSQLPDGLGPRIRRKHRFHPMMIMAMVHSMEESDDRALGWLMAMSAFKAEAAWSTWQSTALLETHVLFLKTNVR